MWVSNDCGCFTNNILLEEISLKKPPINLNRNYVVIESPAICKGLFKEDIINDFLKILDLLECGIQPDLEPLLEKLSLMDENEYI